MSQNEFKVLSITFIKYILIAFYNKLKVRKDNVFLAFFSCRLSVENIVSENPRMQNY